MNFLIALMPKNSEKPHGLKLVTAQVLRFSLFYNREGEGDEQEKDQKLRNLGR